MFPIAPSPEGPEQPARRRRRVSQLPPAPDPGQASTTLEVRVTRTTLCPAPDCPLHRSSAPEASASGPAAEVDEDAVVTAVWPSGLVGVWKGEQLVGSWYRTRFRRRLAPYMLGTPEWSREFAARALAEAGRCPIVRRWA